MASAKLEQPAQVAEVAPPKHDKVVETSHSEVAKPPVEEVKSNPFEEIKEQKVEQPKVEPAQIPLPEYGHGKNYEWLLGRLQRVHSPKHQWKIRYADLDQHDEWGGSMILAPDARLDNWKDGDLVYIEGEILTERPSLYLTGPLYRTRIIRAASEVSHIIPRIGK